MSILNKSSVAWQLAIATALGAYGGFPSAPLWWRKITQYKITQFMTLWLLVYQGGGKGELLWTTLVSAIVFFLMSLFSYSDDIKQFLLSKNLKTDTRFFN
tara:strand:- start:81 stop:380 length:300 start_codon:yes stop_codon:yes gene_type:complete